MQTKLTLRLEDGIIRKAKRIAKKRRTSVSRIVSDYFAALDGDGSEHDLPRRTRSMVGVLQSSKDTVNEDSYRKYLESKYL